MCFVYSHYRQGQCTASTVYLHPTDTPGVYKANYGHLVQTFKVVYADEDNMGKFSNISHEQKFVPGFKSSGLSSRILF